MLGRSIEDEMARITERGCEHAASAWLCIAEQAEQAEQQLHARQQARFFYNVFTTVMTLTLQTTPMFKS